MSAILQIQMWQTIMHIKSSVCFIRISEIAQNRTFGICDKGKAHARTYAKCLFPAFVNCEINEKLLHDLWILRRDGIQSVSNNDKRTKLTRINKPYMHDMRYLQIVHAGMIKQIFRKAKCEAWPSPFSTDLISFIQLCCKNNSLKDTKRRAV